MTTTSISGLATSYNTTADDNYNVPTNPLINFTPAYSGSERLFSIILKDDSTTKDTSSDLIKFTEPISSAGLLEEYSNLSATNGFSIRCYDSFSQVGLNLASVTVDSAGVPTSNDYFVLIHSDNESMHHFARITKILSADVTGDKFEFEPRLGNEIAQDVKFMVFKGPPRSDKIVAVSAGIKRQVANYVCSEPLFYFFEDQLDKKGELNHNTKYFVRTKDASSGSLTVLNQTNQNVACMTISDYRNKIIDYSKFSYHIDLVDKLRVLDDPDTATANESTALSGTFVDYHDYNDCFINARRDTDDATTAKVMTGPTRYVNYKFSPENNNYVPIVYELDVEDSFDAKAGFSNLKLVDTTRNLSNKVFNNDRLMVKQKIEEDDLNEFVEVGEIKTLNDASNREYELEIVVPKPTLYFTVNNEIMIGDRICIVDSIPSDTLIRLKTNSRLETEAAFTTSTSLTGFTAGTKIYRRRLNPLDNTYFTGTQISEEKLSNLNLILQTTEYKDFFCDVGSFITNVNEEYGLLTITFENNMFNSDSALFYAIGSVFLYNEIFFGQVEQIDKKFENGQSVFEIQGRNTLSKLVDISVNKDTAFSQDIIYSSDSPFNNLFYISRTGTATFDSTTLTVNSSVTLNAGDKIFVKYGNDNMVYVGQIATTATGTSFTLSHNSYAEFTTLHLYKAISKHYVFNKALSASTLVGSATSLSGASDKGVFFQSGNKIDSTATAFEGKTLVGASSEDANGIKYNPNAIGFYDLESKAMKSDSVFQTRLSDGATDYETFDTINTLMDFTILSVKEEGGSKRVELAPYLPLALGRVQYNYANTQDTTFSTLAGTCTANVTLPLNYILTDIVTFDSQQLYSTLSIPRRFHGKPLYIDRGSGKEFLGLITHVQIRNTSSYNQLQIFFDGQATSSTGDEIYVLTYDSTFDESTKLSHELLLLNGGHLHGGKIITKLHPLKPSTVGGRIHTFDYPLYYNSMTVRPITYSEKFGSSFFRIYNLEKGNISAKKQTAVYHHDAAHHYDKPSEIKYYAGAYRFNRGYVSGVDSLLGENKKAQNQTHILHESRGFDSVMGSRFWDTTVHALAESPDVLGLKAIGTFYLMQYLSKDYIHQVDSKVARMFLFANADLHPYFGGRTDSLMSKDGSGNYKDISNYGLLSLKTPSVTNNQDPKHMLSGSTSTITLKDSDYASSTIVSSDKTVGQLKRFGIMRLTELVFDWHFNQFDPENPPDKDKTIPKIFSLTMEPTTVTVTSATRSTAKTLVIVPHLTAFTANSEVFDSKGRYIGKIDSVTHNAGVDTTVVFDEEPFKTDGTNFATGYYLICPDEYYDLELIRGHGNKDTIVELSENNFLSTFVTQDAFETTKSGTAYGDNYGNDLGGSSNDVDYVAHMILPAVTIPEYFHARSTGTRTSIHDSKVLEHFSRLKEGDDPSLAAPETHDLYMKYFVPVFLDRHSIEDGSELVDEGMSGDFIEAIHNHRDTSGTASQKGIRVGIHMASPFADKAHIGGSSGATYDKTADGVFAGFKPVIRIDSSLSNISKTDNKAIGNKSVYHYSITSTDFHKWLDFVDLTGCYLVSTTGKYYDEEGAVATLSHGESLDEVTPTKIAYILSHEIDDTVAVTAQSPNSDDGNRSINMSSTDSRRHILTVSKDVDAGYYRIMQPNHTCFHDFSPKRIRINTLSSKYTKKAYKDEMYDSIKSYHYRDARGKRTEFGNNEGVLSMYVTVDGDGLTSDDHLVVTGDDHHRLELIGNTKIDACLSDGDNVLRTSLQYRESLIANSGNSDNIGRFFELGEMKKLLGVVSVSETFSILVNGDIDTNAKRAMIGSTATVCTEVEDLVEQVFIENDIKHSITKEDYEIFASPDFQGNNLFNLTNYLLSLKDKKLIGQGDTVKVVNADDSSFISKYSFDDDDFLSIESKKSNFGYFNEITVYGKTHKAVRKNFKEIKKRGKKSLEVFEEKLNTQDEVNKEALKLLKIYTNLDEVLYVEISKSTIKMLSVGDTVIIESKFSNIERNKFLVLEMKHSLNGTIGLKLGKYIKGLEDTLAKLLVDNKSTKSYIRKKEFNLNENTFDFFDDIKIKEMHLLIRKKETTGSTLGFSTTLNTNTNPLGFSGGSATYTTLLEEDL